MIQNKYEARDLGEITHFLGINIERGPESIRMNQKTYIQELLGRYGLHECRPAYIPLELGNSKLSSEDSPKTDEERQDMKNIPYRELIGSLGYISQCT